jgi:hypothetical protein
MKPRSARDVASALEKKGFEPRLSHHMYYHFRYQGRDVGISTKISHGETELGRPLLGMMKRQLQLDSSTEFERLVNCPMSEADYIEYLKKKGVIPEE